MADILRGEIWWANLNPTRGREQSGIRPILIISQNIFNRHSGTVIALALTSQAPTAEFPLTFFNRVSVFTKTILGENKSN